MSKRLARIWIGMVKTFNSFGSTMRGIFGYIDMSKNKLYLKHPQEFNTTRLFSQRITVRIVLSANTVIGPLFIHTNLIVDKYPQMLKNELLLLMKSMPNLIFIFQQDGTNPYIMDETCFFHKYFHSHVISNHFLAAFNCGWL